MKISIAICTHNRAAVLGDTLESLRRVEIPAGVEIQLIVVDNRSADNTREVVERAFSLFDGVDCSYVWEERLGISNARNAALAYAKGDVIAYVDDDVFFDQGWLDALLAAFDANPDAACVAGAVRLYYETERPKWLDPDPEWLNMEHLFSMTGYGPNARRLKPHETPLGCNWAFRTIALKSLGGFSGALGRHGKVLLSKEESELYFRLNAAGMKAVFAPDAIVHHRVPAERTTKEWMTRRFYWQGISQVVFDQLTAPKSRRELLRAALADVARLKSLLLGDSWRPNRIYWHVSQYKFYHRAFAAYLFALIRKRVAIALGSQYR